MVATLKPAVWMTAACAASLAIAAAFVDGRLGELVAGMAGPLAAVIATWVVVERAVRKDPVSVGRRLLSAFFVKALFFGAYVILALRVLELEPRVFIVSFTCYFVGLYLTEALMFRRLFASPEVRS